MSEQEANPKPATLDQVFDAMRQWRKNKKEYGATIPENIWSMLFELEKNGYTDKEIRRLFAIGAKQYEIRKKQLSLPAKPPAVNIPEESEHVTFCEATASQQISQAVPSLSEAAKQTKDSLSVLRSTADNPETYLDLSTTIVEYCRPDGYCLKIHTTHQKLPEVMQAFAEQGIPPHD